MAFLKAKDRGLIAYWLGLRDCEGVRYWKEVIDAFSEL